MAAQAHDLRPRIGPALARHFVGIKSTGERVRHLFDCFAAGCRGALCARARGSAGAVRQLAPIALVVSNDADYHRLRRCGSGIIPWSCDRRHGDDLRARRVRAVDRHSRHRLCGRASAPRFPPHLGSRDARAVFPRSLSCRDRRTHAHATKAGRGGANGCGTARAAWRLYVFHRFRRGRGEAGATARSPRPRIFLWRNGVARTGPTHGNRCDDGTHHVADSRRF